MQNQSFTHLRAYCIGNQTADEAKKFGFANCIIAKEAAIDSLVQIIVETETAKRSVTDMDLLERSRRLRGTPILRELVRETRCSKSSLIYPMFVKEGTNIKEEIPSMQGQYRYSPGYLIV